MSLDDKTMWHPSSPEHNRKQTKNLAELKGFRAVAEALRLEDYPIDKEGIDYAVGDLEVEDGTGAWLRVRKITDRVKRERFGSAEEVVRALRDAILSGKSQAA